MKRIGWLVLICAAACVCSCRRHDIRTVHVYVPDMKNEACAEVIVRSLGKLQNIAPHHVTPDLTNRIVTVRFDSLNRSIKNIEYAIADSGFAANGIPADLIALNALPPECGIPKVPANPRTMVRSVRSN